jgi:CubicO group peptidase (beta-lactamase class C family)
MIRRAVLATVSCICVSVATTGAQVGSPSDSASRWVDSLFAPYAADQGPGCAVGIARNAQLSFAKGYGFADLARHKPITPDTRFYIASVSKQFTAMSIVLLAQDGRLSLDDSIRKWVPEVPAVANAITLRQLLHHTSGLRDYFTLLAVSGWPTDGALTEKQFLDLIGRQKTLNFNPGDEFLYSNTGYVLLSIVVKRASGKSLRDFAKARIFDPLGMTHTEFRDDHRMAIPNVAIGYQTVADGYRISQPEFDVVGDGGVYSTVGDLAKWEANFVSGRVGGAAGLTQMTTAGRLNNGQVVPYALALSIGDLNGLPTFSHSGAYGGYRASLVRFPDKELSVITLCNTTNATPALAERVGSLMLGVLPTRTSPTKLDLSTVPFNVGGERSQVDSSATRRRNDLLTQLAGSYYSEELDLPVTLTVRDGTIVLHRAHSEDLRFVGIAGDLFVNGDQILLQVTRDDNKNASGFTLTISRARGMQFVRRDTDHGLPQP